MPMKVGMDLPVPTLVLLGAILLKSGLITPDQLEDALSEQMREGGRLGEILRARGWVTSEDIARAMAEQYGIEFVDLAEETRDDDAAALLPVDVARRWNAVAVRFDDEGRVVVALADPSDGAAVNAVRSTIASGVRLAVADEVELARVLADLRAAA
jgi:type IV pilus assembly protein PilB